MSADSCFQVTLHKHVITWKLCKVGPTKTTYQTEIRWTLIVSQDHDVVATSFLQPPLALIGGPFVLFLMKVVWMRVEGLLHDDV